MTTEFKSPNEEGKKIEICKKHLWYHICFLKDTKKITISLNQCQLCLAKSSHVWDFSRAEITKKALIWKKQREIYVKKQHDKT